MKHKLFCALILIAVSLPLAAATFEIGLGYQLGLAKNLKPNETEGESGDTELSNAFAFNVRYFLLPSVAVTFKGSLGSFDKLVWRNPAYDHIKNKSDSQLALETGGWGGFSSSQLVALKNYLPKERYEFTSNDGSLLALDFLIGIGTEIPLWSQLSISADFGITGHYKSVSYEQDVYHPLTGKKEEFNSSVTSTSIGIGLGLGFKYGFSEMIYAELGGSASWDFTRRYNVNAKVGGTTIIDVSGEYEGVSILNFGAPYLLIGFHL
jgi:hypothetical protein